MADAVLVIGATGFLGGFVVDALANRDPIALIRATSDRTLLPKRIETRVGDLDQPDSLPLDGVSTLIYCASMGFGQVPGLVARLAETDVRRAVFVSTTAIFTSLPAQSRVPRLEAEAAVRSSPLDWTIVRPTMIYGTPRDRNISRLLRYLKRWPIFPLCGNALWQPVHVADLAQAIVSSIDRPSSIHRTYDVAGRDPLRFADLIRSAARAVGRSVLLVPVPVRAAVVAARLTRVVTAEQIRRLAEDKAFSYADAMRDLDFDPRSFEAGVREEAQLMGLTSSPHPSGQAH